MKDNFNELANTANKAAAAMAEMEELLNKVDSLKRKEKQMLNPAGKCLMSNAKRKAKRTKRKKR